MSAASAPERIAPIDGVILYDKPAGVTSHDIVARVRRTFVKGTKVGHAGTLDPFATGLLLVLVGRATRIQRFLMELRKSYETVAQFGAVSSTGDRDGEIVQTGVVPAGALPLSRLTGEIMQRPPAYSAVHVDGRRAYELARSGVEVALPERQVTVHRFDQLWADGDRRAFAIDCSSGTYVRSLVMALGDAYCDKLRRTAIGPFAVADADPARILPLGDALGFIPAVVLDADGARRASHGVAVSLTAEAPGDGTVFAGTVRLLDPEGALIALAEPRPGGQLKPIVGFRG